MTTTGISQDGIRDRNCCFPPTQSCWNILMQMNNVDTHYTQTQTLVVSIMLAHYTLHTHARSQTYCWGPWRWWVVSAGWFVCMGSGRSRCSRSWNPLGAHLKSKGLRSGTGTPCCSEAAFGSLKCKANYIFVWPFLKSKFIQITQICVVKFLLERLSTKEIVPIVCSVDYPK